MTRTSYPDPDNAFGQLMLTVRSRMGLTQGQLATRLGISRQAVADWETRGKRPTANHLQNFIGLAVQHKVFSGVQAVDDIKALWAAANQKVLMDDAWLSQLLASPPDLVSSPDTPTSTSHEPRLHWDDALVVDTFYGRDSEMSILNDWVIHHRCRVVTLLGMGGMGKSALAATLMHQLANQFEIVIWRSLRDLPTCDALFIDLLRVLMPHALEEGNTSVERRLALLMEHLRAARMLLVLDNVESVLEEGEITGRMKAGYEDFGRFLRQSAETQHQSTVLLTSRQKLHDIMRYEGTHAPVRSLRLSALNSAACEQLLADRKVVGSPSEQAQLIEAYTGNPLALKIVAQTIVDLFDGELKPFLDQGSVVFGDIHELLHQQYVRLSSEECRIVVWLAIMREPITLKQLQTLFVVPVPTVKVLETIDKLYRHSLIERGQSVGSFTLQSVVLEYLTNQLIAEASAEIRRGELVLLIQHGLEQAQVKDYVRETQTRLLIAPILAQLQSSALLDLNVQLYTLLDHLRETPAELQGYGPANLVALLRHLRGHLRDLDLSCLVLRGVYLQGVEMQDARLTRAVMRDCDFTETFDSINSLTHSLNGQYWAASSEIGEVRLWDANGHTLVRLWSSSAGIIYRIALSPDGQMLAGGTWDGTLKVWDTTTGALLWMVNWPQVVGAIYRLNFSPDGSLLMCVGSDLNVRLLRVSDGLQMQMLTTLRPVTMVAWSADGSLLATGEADGTIRVWSVNRYNPEPAVCVHVIEGHKTALSGLSFSSDSHLLVSGDRDGKVKFWDVTSGQFIKPLNINANYGLNVLWSPDGRTIAICGDVCIIWLWDVETEKLRLALQGHTATVHKMFFTPDSRQIVSASTDGVIRFWEHATGKCMRVIDGYTAALSELAWSPDGQQILAGGTDHLVTIYTVDKSLPPRLLYGHTRMVYSVSWSPDGRWLASSNGMDVIHIWDAKSGECKHTLHSPENVGNGFYGLCWSPNSQRLAMGTATYGVAIWQFGAMDIEYVPFPTLIRGRVTWSPAGTHIAAAGRDRVIYIWDAEGALIRQMTGHTTQVTSIEWSDDGTQLLSVGTNEFIVWDVHRGAAATKVTAPIATLSTGEWSADEQIVITGSMDGTMHWWDVLTGQCVSVRDAHQGVVQSIRKSADRTKLASCSNDGAIMIWDIHTGERLQTLRRDRPYERLNITGIKGLTEAQLATLRQLGAIEEASM